MMKSTDVFKTSDLQFGFKPQSSTAKCMLALMETVNYFQQNKSEVFVLFHGRLFFNYQWSEAGWGFVPI